MPAPTPADPILPPGISVVVPVYNSADILPTLVTRLASVLQATGLHHEVILVDDGSTDQSWSVILRLADKNHPWIRGLCLMRNYGQHNAVLAGIRVAQFETTVTMDDDLQHPPEELPKLLAQLGPEIDVVYGAPEKEPHGFVRNISSWVTKIVLQGATGAENARMVSALRVLRTRLRDAFASYSGPFVSIDVLLTWGTRRFSSIRVRHEPRPVGKSNYTYRRLLHHAVNIFTGFSVLPLRLASFVGFAFTVFGFWVLVFVLTNYLIHDSSVAGFPFLASIIALFSGAQLFALGIIGEYLARIHFRTMNKPSYALAAATPHRSKP